MFNMFKHEDSVIFDPIWCSVIGSDISKSTGAPKKRFLEEYERDLCYRRCAKKLIEDDLIYGVTNANYAKRPDAMKITAVIYQLMYGDKEADYAKLLSLFGKEYASTADVVSGLYRRMTDRRLSCRSSISRIPGAATSAMLRFSLSIFWQALKATCRKTENPLRDSVKCSRKSIRRGRAPVRCRTSRRFS